jgi:dipeptidyl aminopeptidase/acylaminoacyl peptidase
MRPLTGLTGTAHFGTSTNGTLVYLPGPVRTFTTERLLGTATREGAITRLGVAPGPYEHVRVSPDGTRLLVSSFDGTEGAVWIYPLDGRGPLHRLALQGRNTVAIWAPDGRRIAVQSNSANERAIFVVRDDGTGFERLTTPAAGEAHTPESWSPDGRYVSFSAAGAVAVEPLPWRQQLPGIRTVPTCANVLRTLALRDVTREVHLTGAEETLEIELTTRCSERT